MQTVPRVAWTCWAGPLGRRQAAARSYCSRSSTKPGFHSDWSSSPPTSSSWTRWPARSTFRDRLSVAFGGLNMGKYQLMSSEGKNEK